MKNVNPYGPGPGLGNSAMYLSYNLSIVFIKKSATTLVVMASDPPLNPLSNRVISPLEEIGRLFLMALGVTSDKKG